MRMSQNFYHGQSCKDVSGVIGDFHTLFKQYRLTIQQVLCQVAGAILSFPQSFCEKLKVGTFFIRNDTLPIYDVEMIFGHGRSPHKQH